MSDYIEVCEQAARTAGKLLLDQMAGIRSREKSPRDLVTDADLAAQKTIREVLLGAFPDHDFAGEEDFPVIDRQTHIASFGKSRGEFRWIVDPLDGTVNYVHGLAGFAVSIGLERSGEIIAGVVFDPWADECFTAERGRGAFLNGQPIGASGCAQIEESLIAVSFSANTPRNSTEIKRFLEVLHRSRAVRRLGSAALNLCYVAAGRLDGYFATSVKAWDVAAGVLLVEEAAGRLTAIDGQPFQLADPHILASASPQLHEQILDVLKAADS